MNNVAAVSKVISFQAAMAKRQKIRYIITIDDDETSIYAARELKPGVITIMITARTPEEAESLRKESTAIAKQGQRIMAVGGIAK